MQSYKVCSTLTNIWDSITAYCTKRALLTLEHNHPIGNSVKVMVDVGLLLNSLTSNETRIGEWLNVMGYITSNPVPKSNLANREIGVQAIVLWSANTFDLVGYERSLDSKKKET
jgi:hypothetical protein